MTQSIEQSTVDRMVALVRNMAKTGIYYPLPAHYEAAVSIAALLPPPADPDLVTAREIAANIGMAGASLGPKFPEDGIRAGLADDSPPVAHILAALRKAREEGVRS